jgi:hypothetical protein
VPLGGHSISTRLRPSRKCLMCTQGFPRFYNKTVDKTQTISVDVFHIPHGKAEPCEDQEYEGASNFQR